VADFTYLVSRVVRMGKAVMPLAVAKIEAFACKQCFSIASVSLKDNKLKVYKCRCV